MKELTEQSLLTEVLAKGAQPSDQKEFILEVIADNDKSLSGYIAAWHLSADDFMKNRYFLRAVEATRQEPTRMNYSEAYLFCRDIGEEEAAEQLLEEMAEIYPLFSTFHILALKTAALVKRGNSRQSE